MPTDTSKNRKAVLELFFIALLGLAVAGAFIAALSYDFISARAPLFVMVPLLLLIGVQFNRTRKKAHARDAASELLHAISGENRNFNGVAGFIGLMALLLLLIYVGGHYVGISVFMFVMLRWISREGMLLALTISLGVTALIFVLFEYGFNIELYRGYLARWLAR